MLLPIFQERADAALDAAERAERVGIDGVFCYDHLWPIGQPGRPALAPFPVLALVAARTRRVAVGTLVARVGLVPDAVLLTELAALATIAPGRVVAGMGTGDRLSAGENTAYGLDFEPAEVRRARLGRCVRAAKDLGLTVWIGGGGTETRRVALEEGVALNMWEASPAEVRRESAVCEVTWGGAASGALEPTVARLAESGATWAVFAWPVDVEELAAAVAATR